MSLILASQSPRRNELLRQFGFRFSIETSAVEELEIGDPLLVAKENAKLKALPVSLKHPEALVLGADTIVVFHGQLLGKPHDEETARQMLSLLSGQEHEVITFVALLKNGEVLSTFHEITQVKFRKLSQEVISGYIATKEPFDKAGGYGIQGFGGLLVESIKGCYYNVVGLPVPSLAEELRKYGIEVFA